MRDGFGAFNYVRDVVIPVSKEYEPIQKERADLIVNGNRSKNEVVGKILQSIRGKLLGTGIEFIHGKCTVLGTPNLRCVLDRDRIDRINDMELDANRLAVHPGEFIVDQSITET